MKFLMVGGTKDDTLMRTAALYAVLLRVTLHDTA